MALQNEWLAVAEDDHEEGSQEMAFPNSASKNEIENSINYSNSRSVININILGKN